MTPSSELSAMVAELEALLAKATPGPWRFDAPDVRSMDRTVKPDGRRRIASLNVAYKSSEEYYANADLIVAAVNALPTLLADLETMQAALVDLQMARSNWKKYQDQPGDEYVYQANKMAAAIDGLITARAALQTRKAKP